MSHDPLRIVLERLGGQGGKPHKSGRDGYKALCPAHDDHNPSLSVGRGDGGGVVVHCHAGCSPESVVEALGLTLADLAPPDDGREGRALKRKPKAEPEPSQRKPRKVYQSVEAVIESLARGIGGELVGNWPYPNGLNREVMRMLRFNKPDGKKAYRPIHPVNGGWRVGDPPGKLPLYRLPELIGVQTVYLCEGEKAADAARELGFVATTTAHGAKAVGNSDLSPLRGKDVIILPDNDDPGRAYAQVIASVVSRMDGQTTAKIVTLPDLLEHGDIVEFIADREADGKDAAAIKAEIKALAERAEPECGVGGSDDGQAVSDEQQPAIPDLAVIESYHPFPLAVLPETVRRFVGEGAKSIGCDPSYIALPLLAGLSAAVGNTRRIRLKSDWAEPCNIWTAVIGESGTHKTPAQRLALGFLHNRQAIEVEQHQILMEGYEVELAEYEKQFKAWQRSKNSAPPTKPDRPMMRRVLCSDVTVEALAPLLMDNPRGLLLVRDELSGWLGSFNAYKPGSSDVSHWLEMFQGGPMTVDRKTGDRHTLHVPRAAVNITGGIQPEALRKALGREHFENGLTARMLMAMPPRLPKRWTDSEVSPTTKAAMDEVFVRLYELDFTSDGEPIGLPLSADALEVWIEFYNEHAAEQAKLTGDLAAAWSKLEAYAARFALLIHLVRAAEYGPTMVEAQTIDADSVRAGVALARWFGREAKRVYAVLNESGERKDRRKVIEFIQSRGGSVTVRELMRAGPCCLSADTAKAILSRLAADGLGYRTTTPANAKGGRPVERFHLTPATDTDTTCLNGQKTGVVSVSVDQGGSQAPGGEAA